MAVNSIGSFNFVVLSGVRPGQPLEFEQPELELRQRPGVDGTGLVDLGTKGQPFPVRTLVDVSTYLAGLQLLKLYVAVVGTGPLVVVHGGVNYHDRFRTKYDVLRVTPVRCSRAASQVGGLSASSTAVVEAVWELLPVDST